MQSICSVESKVSHGADIGAGSFQEYETVPSNLDGILRIICNVIVLYFLLSVVSCYHVTVPKTSPLIGYLGDFSLIGVGFLCVASNC